MGFLNNLVVKIKGDRSHLDSTLDRSESKIKRWSRNVGALIAAGFAIAGVAIMTVGKQLVDLASKTEGVKIAFQRLGAPGLLEGLRAATRGTVSDLQLMQKAVQANNFKIPLSQLATYFEFATKRAIQTGESVDYLVDSIITGIGRKSVLVMDNLGISAVELQNEVKKTGDFATAAGVIIRRELTSMGDVADTTATKMASIKVAIENLKTGLGLKITESTFFQGLTNWVNNIGKFAQVPGMSLAQAIYGATVKPTEFNKMLDESNKLIAENAAAILKQKEAISGISGAKRKVVAPPTKITGFKVPGMPSGALPGIQDYGGIDSMTKEFGEMQIAIMNLSETFASFFSGINLGFQGMIDGIITGIKRLVMELMAKAVWLAILGAITGVPLTGGMFKNLLFGSSVNTLIKGGALGTGPAKSNIPASGASVGNMSQQLVATLKGKDVQILLRRS